MRVILEVPEASDPLVPQGEFWDGTRLDTTVVGKLIGLIRSKGNGAQKYQVVKDNEGYILFPLDNTKGVLRYPAQEQSPNWPHRVSPGTSTWSVASDATFISMLVNEFGAIQKVTLVSPPGSPVENSNLKIDFLDSSTGKIVSSLDSSNVKVVRNA